jgi:hypothetical protein
MYTSIFKSCSGDNQNLHVISTNVEKIMGPINIFDATLMLWANRALEIFTAVVSSRKLDARRSVKNK